jgi:hypothetical protein
MVASGVAVASSLPRRHPTRANPKSRPHAERGRKRREVDLGTKWLAALCCKARARNQYRKDLFANISANIFGNAVLFLGASQRPSTYQLCHALHHMITAKKPHGKAAFSKTLGKKHSKTLDFCLHRSLDFSGKH